MESENAKLAAEMFDHFCSVTTMRQIMGLHRNMLDAVGLRPGPLNEFYPKLKSKIKNWKAQALWKKFDARAAHRVYNKGTACSGVRVLVIGAGPCGLRTAIEAQLLGAKVVVVEKRDRISRNNVLHLWPFVITDLRNLGAKKFYGKFCAGSIDHISIRQLQCILLKVALLLGVEVHEGVSFVKLVEPKDGCGWRAQVSPEDHGVSFYEFDALIGADGKRNTLEGFVRKEFRGKLAIAITANFINKRTEAEAKVEEISGVAFIFNQSFFKELYYRTGIDLENIVYYKDETHYFVMTAKKMSLIDKGVIIQDSADPAELLSPSNVNTDKLLDYAREAAEFSTKYQMPNLEFAVNHYGKPDVAMFDFTSMFQAENSSRISVRKNYRLLQCLVGDSLLEPFWPTGSGCARGFLSSMDAAYAIKLFANQRNSCLAVLAQRESLYRLLGQTTPENLNRDIMAYTLDPSTRYPNLNKMLVQVQQVEMLLDADDPAVYQQTFMDTNAISTVPDAPVRRKRRTGDTTPLGMVLLRWIKSQLHAYEFANGLTDVSQCFTHGKVLCALIHRYRPDLLDFPSLAECTPEQSNARAFDILEKDLGIARVMQSSESVNIDKMDSKVWLNYLEQICELFRGEIPHVKHPKLDFAELKEKQRSNIPDFSNLVKSSGKRNVAEVEAINRRVALDEDRHKNRTRRLNAELMQAAQASEGPRRAKKRRSHEKFSSVDRDRGIYSALPRGTPDEKFSNRIKSMESKITSRNTGIGDKKPKDLLRAIGKIESDDWNVREIEKKIEQSKKIGAEVGKSREKVPKWSREQFLARQNKMSKPLDRQSSIDEKFKEIDMTIKSLDKQLKEGHNLDRGERGRNKVASIAGQFVKKPDGSSSAAQQEDKGGARSLMNSKLGLVLTSQGVSEICHFCKQKVYLMEKISAEGLVMHRSCLKCNHCHTNLRLGGYAFDRDGPDGMFYCNQHFKLPPKPYKPVTKRQPQYPKHEEISAKTSRISPEKVPRAENIVAMDLLDRGQTPERIEFENVDAMSDGERSLNNIIDENEWTDRNFGTGTDETDSDLTSSDSSDSETDSDLYEEALDSPLGAETLQLATDWIGKQRICSLHDSDGDEFYDSSEDDDVDTQTEGEELARAREIRMQEVKLMPPVYPATDTETEVVSRDFMSSSPPKHDRSEIIWGCKGDYQVPESINQLNDKLYNLNHYLNVNRDIEALKKDNLVRDDIRKKQNLKEQWLANVPSHSDDCAAASINDRFMRFRSNSRDSSCSKSSSVLASTNALHEFASVLDIPENVGEFSGDDEVFKDCAPTEEDIQFDNLVLHEDKKKKKPSADDDLLTFEEEEALLKEMSQNKLKLLQTMRDIESRNFKDTLSAISGQTPTPKVTAQSSVDLSKYFPESKKATSQNQNVNKNQKELKDVDLSKYFSQNQPSSSKASPAVVRKDLTSPLPKESEPKREEKKEEEMEKKKKLSIELDDSLCESDFNMFDQLLDGAIDLKMFMAHIERSEPAAKSKKPQSSKSIEPPSKKIKPIEKQDQLKGKKAEDDTISVAFDEILDSDNYNTDIDNLLSDRELDQCSDDIHGEIFDEILMRTRSSEKVNARQHGVAAATKTKRQRQSRKTSFRDRAPAQGGITRGIESILLPPKPKVIREVPRATSKKVVSGKSVAPPTNPPKKIASKSVPNLVKATKQSSGEKITNKKPQEKNIQTKKEEIPAKLSEKKETKPYISDPKVSKYFFNDDHIFEDLSPSVEKTPSLGDYDESKILDQFEEILQELKHDENRPKIENLKIVDHVQEICDKIDLIQITDTVSHSIGDQDILSRVVRDQFVKIKSDLDQFLEKTPEKSTEKITNSIGDLKISPESPVLVDQLTERPIVPKRTKKLIAKNQKKDEEKVEEISASVPSYDRTKILDFLAERRGSQDSIKLDQDKKLSEITQSRKNSLEDHPVEVIDLVEVKERSLQKKLHEECKITSNVPSYDRSKILDFLAERRGSQDSIKLPDSNQSNTISEDHPVEVVDLAEIKKRSPQKKVLKENKITPDIPDYLVKQRGPQDSVKLPETTQSRMIAKDPKIELVNSAERKKKVTEEDKIIPNERKESQDSVTLSETNQSCEVLHKKSTNIADHPVEVIDLPQIKKRSPKKKVIKESKITPDIPSYDRSNFLTERKDSQDSVKLPESNQSRNITEDHPVEVVDLAEIKKRVPKESEITLDIPSYDRSKILDYLAERRGSQDSIKFEPKKAPETGTITEDHPIEVIDLAEVKERSREKSLGNEINIKPSDRTSISPARTTMQKPRDQPFIRDYDNDTHKLLRKSRDLHHKKQEFMNERMSETNPYLKRVMNRSYLDERSHLNGVDRYHSNYSSKPTVLPSTSSRLPPLSYTGGHYSGLESLRRPTKPSRNYSSRDACCIS